MDRYFAFVAQVAPGSCGDCERRENFEMFHL